MKNLTILFVSALLILGTVACSDKSSPYVEGAKYCDCLNKVLANKTALEAGLKIYNCEKLYDTSMAKLVPEDLKTYTNITYVRKTIFLVQDVGGVIEAAAKEEQNKNKHQSKQS